MHPAPQPLIRDILGLLPVEATLEEMMDDYGNERRQVASYVRGLSGHTDIDTPSRQQLSSMIYSYFLNHGPVGNDAKADAATALELLEARQPYFVTRKEWVRDHLADYDAAVQACAPLQGQTTVAAGEALHDLHSRRLDLEKSFTRLLRINRLLGQELEPQMQKMPAPYRDNTKTLDFLRLFATDARSAQPGRDRVKLLIGEMIAGRRVKESKQEIGAIYDGFAKLCRELPPRRVGRGGGAAGRPGGHGVPHAARGGAHLPQGARDLLRRPPGHSLRHAGLQHGRANGRKRRWPSITGTCRHWPTPMRRSDRTSSPNSARRSRRSSMPPRRSARRKKPPAASARSSPGIPSPRRSSPPNRRGWRRAWRVSPW